MQQQLKFRAWDAKKGEWLLGYKSSGGFSLFGECMLLGEWGKVLDDAMHERIDLKVMLFTGQQDKHGVDIYEHDILRGPTRSHKQKLELVEWDDAQTWDADGSFAVIGGFTVFNALPRESEIIGNKWDNPELIKELGIF